MPVQLPPGGPAVTASHQVRWKHGRRWRYGLWRYGARSADGSMTVSELERRHDDKGARTRSLRPATVEVRQPGPRGGAFWVPAIELLEEKT
jgi:hypothetical protein